MYLGLTFNSAPFIRKFMFCYEYSFKDINFHIKPIMQFCYVRSFVYYLFCLFWPNCFNFILNKFFYHQLNVFLTDVICKSCEHLSPQVNELIFGILCKNVPPFLNFLYEVCCKVFSANLKCYINNITNDFIYIYSMSTVR